MRAADKMQRGGPASLRDARLRQGFGGLLRMRGKHGGVILFSTGKRRTMEI
jgi:hypothetical protein